MLKQLVHYYQQMFRVVHCIKTASDFVFIFKFPSFFWLLMLLFLWMLLFGASYAMTTVALVHQKISIFFEHFAMEKQENYGFEFIEYWPGCLVFMT